MLSFLKNKVGRPSNETIKKRRLFYLICVLLIILFIAVGTYTLTSNTNTSSSFDAFDLDKLTGNVSSIGKEVLNIKYTDNVKNDSAPKNTTISIREKFSYTGTDKVYYRLDLYKSGRIVEKGLCRQVNNDKLAAFSFKLTTNKLSVVTGIYSDLNCTKLLSKYKTKDYYIGTSNSKDDVVQLASIELPKFASTWYVGDSSEAFSLNVVPTSSTVTLTSSNPDIMTVVQNGVNNFRLEAKKAGKVTITAKASDGVDATVTYTVKEKNQITMTKFSEEWTVGSYANAIVKSSASDSVANVVSSNSTVMEVTKIEENIYKLTAKKAGTATITATSKGGAKQSYTYKVVEKSSIAIPDYTSVLTVGKTHGKFALTVTPKTATVTLISSNPSVLQVMKYGDNSWGLKAKKTGTVTITAKSSDGAKKEYKYTVVDEAKILNMPKYPDEWQVGDSYEKFSITVAPSSSTVTLTSSDNSVIEVIKNGTNNWSLKAKKVGTATVTASASNGLKTSYTYTVKQQPTINMPKYSNELEVGKTYGKFKLTTNTTGGTVTVASSNPSVLQVMKYGDNSISGNSWGLKAKKAGTATVTASSSAGAKVTYTYTVKEKTVITMPKYSDEWTVGDEYGKFSVTVTPSDQSITVTSSNTSVIEVVKHSTNSWSLKAKKAGTATITAKATNGSSTSYTYTVKEKATVSIPSYASEWTVGTSSKEFSATVTPSNATVSITSSNSSVMEVLNKGNNKWQLKAKAAGTATITVTTSAGAKATYTYTVKAAPTITMQKFADELNVGTTYGKFSLETNTPDATVSLISSNPSVLEVVKHSTNSWSLKALKAGTAQITATSSAGATLTYTYKVVAPQLIMSDSDIVKSAEYGYIMFLTVGTVTPSNSTVTVTSSNSSVISVSTIKANTSWQLKAAGTGTVTITVSSSNGLKKTYTCVVTEPKVKTTISMPKFNSTLDEGTQTNKFSITVSPTSESVSLSSSNTNVIQVMKHGDNSASGNSWSLKAKAAGTATITAKSSSGATVSYTYTVKKVDSSISMTQFVSTWSSGSSGNVKVTVSPSNSTVTVTSSDPSVMSVKKISNTEWKMKAVNGGTATITASATNGKKVSYTYTVTHAYPSPSTMINSNYETKTTGGVTVYFEKTCSSKSKTNIVNFISKLPTYAKKSGRAVYVMTDSTWKANGHGAGTAGLTWTAAVPYIAIPCGSDYSDPSDNYAIYHEYGHAIDVHYGAISGDGRISESKKYVDLLNSAYKYVSSRGCSKQSNKCTILRGYAYTSSGEFFAESYMMTIRPIVGYSNSDKGITSNWGPINGVSFSPYGTIEAEVKKDIKKFSEVIK